MYAVSGATAAEPVQSWEAFLQTCFFCTGQLNQPAVCWLFFTECSMCVSTLDTSPSSPASGSRLAPTVSLLARMSAPEAQATRTKATRAHTHQVVVDEAQWLPTLLALRARALDRVVAPWCCVVLCACAVTIPLELTHTSEYVDLARFSSAFSLVLTTLSFLLVFRLNRSATRFWETRQQWGKLVEVTRQLGAGAAAHCAHAPKLRDATCAWACAFAVASKDLLRGHTVLDADELEGVLSKEDARATSASPHPPLFCAAAMRAALAAALGPDATLRAAKQMGADGAAWAVAAAQHRAAVWALLEGHVDTLVGQVGGMERIRATPLPLVYVAHLRTFLGLFLCALPLVYVSSWGWGTIPVMGLVAFALLGVEGAATECEAPFQDRPNHHAMDRFAAVAIGNVAEVLRAAEVHAHAEWAYPQKDGHPAEDRV